MDEPLPYYYSDEVTRLQVLLEEVTRAKPASLKSRFVQPEGGVVDRLASRFHHVLYGRRGTGKSSLLRHIESYLRSQGHLVAWADQETFMALSYPDVLISTLAETFRQFASQLEAIERGAHKRSWRTWRPRASAAQRTVNALNLAAQELEDLRNSPDQSDVNLRSTYSDEHAVSLDRAARATLGRGSSSATVGARREGSRKTANGQDMTLTYAISKAEQLERSLTRYRTLMSEATTDSRDAFIILDDFYRLPESVQPQIAGYFHRVVKDTGVWLKIGSISFWTRLYAGGSPAVGLQVPHDIRELSLDRGLLDFKSSKRFLEEILGSLAEECGIKLDHLFSNGALDRLVLAAGGVPRDYIGLVSDSVAVARNRGQSAKAGTDRIIAEDVNTAAGRSVENKFRDMKEDVGGADTGLRSLVVDLTNHCRATSSACFLVDATDEPLMDKLLRLQNMRFVHAIATNETIPGQQSNRYNVFVLDVSQLAAQRAWQVDFMGWTKREKRRARKLVFPSSARLSPPLDASAPNLAQDDALAVVTEIDPSN